MDEILEIKGLTKHYSGFALEGIDLTIKKGYITGFIGPNGSGKTTTIKSILNLINKDGGKISVFGKDHIEHEAEIKNKLGIVLDEGFYYEEMTLAQMKNIIRRFYTYWDESLFTKYIKEFDLPINKKIKTLSKGMRMKYSIAIALSHNAQFLIMDEPTSGLDPLIRSELLEILSQIIQDEEKSVLFSSHITSDLEKIADYIALIYQGKLLFHEEKDGLIERHRIIKGSKELLQDNINDLFVSVKTNGYGFEGLTNQTNKLRLSLGDRVVMEKPTIEDIMLYWVKKVQDEKRRSS